MRTNVPAVNRNRTHGGARAEAGGNPEKELLRTVVNCLLFEGTFYEGGDSIANRIANLVPKCKPEFVQWLAITARKDYNLRHAPLWLAVQAIIHGKGNADMLAQVVSRADELAEALSMYWKANGGKKPLSHQLKKGLAAAFHKFDAYQFGKYNRDNEVKLRDVMFLTHPRPIGKEQEALFKQIADNTLPIPDTWEVALSSGADKKATWERLISEKKLGGLATLRNLRNMSEAGVRRTTISEAIATTRFRGVLPFQFLAASRQAPGLETEIEEAMLRGLEGAERLPGRTMLLVDVSGSMDDVLSKKGTLTRLDAAAAMAVLCREVCEDVGVFTFSAACAQVPARRGMALVDAIHASQPHRATYLGAALRALHENKYLGAGVDRLIVITDEQAHDELPSGPLAKACYMVNVAPYEHGLEGGKAWTRINGWSDRLVDWIRVVEKGGEHGD